MLTEFGVPVEQRAVVRGEMSRPDDTSAVLSMREEEPGVFVASTTAFSYGVYRFRIVAEGRTMRGAAFTREHTVTVATVAGGGQPGGPASTGDLSGRLCQTLQCLLEQPGIQHLLEDKRIDPNELRRCLDHLCKKDPGGRGQQ